MKRYLCIILAVLLLVSLSSCAVHNTYPTANTETYTAEDSVFIQLENGNLLSPWGTEYSFLANEGILCTFGNSTFLGGVLGEVKETSHLTLTYQTGLFALSTDPDQNLLIRFKPNSEWMSIYRRADLPPLDYSVDNCVRLEFLPGYHGNNPDDEHMTCGDGITDREEITEFLADIRAQQSPREAGLYDMITKTDGFLENCYHYATVFGFFAEEPNVAVPMDITSYNDLAYSIRINNWEQEYVLPNEWLERLQVAS